MNDKVAYCIKCGAKVGPDYVFCTNCGAKIENQYWKSPIIEDYKEIVDDLNEKYEIKEKEALKLIEKQFEPPQMTYYKFVNKIDDSRVIFYKKLDSVNNILELIENNTLDGSLDTIKERLDLEIRKMKSILEKLENLISELIINSTTNKQDDEDLEELFENMDELIDSVKDYQ